MRANLLPLLISISISFLQVQASRTNPVNSKRGKLDSTDSSDFCDRDPGEVLFMAHAVILAKV